MVIFLKSTVYPVEAVMQACFQLLDKAYFYIDLDPSGRTIKVCITFKTNGLGHRKPGGFKKVFLEELIHASLRLFLARRNRKLREYIVGSALFSRQGERVGGISENDPLGIALPWEERYAKQENRKLAAQAR